MNSGRLTLFLDCSTAENLTTRSVFSCRFNETFHFLFWTMFGVANQDYVDMPQFVLAEFVGRILYGIFTLVIVIVLLNMLIAMITNSFQKIEVNREFFSILQIFVENLAAAECFLHRTTPTWSGSLLAPSSTSATSEKA